MNMIWNINQEGKEVVVRLEYNVYLGIKKLFVDSVEVLNIKSFKRNKDISFKYNEEDYKIQLVSDDYDYKGYLITPEGEKLLSESEVKVYTKTPLWIIPFVIIDMIIPIIATEALFTWLVGIIASIFTAKVSKNSKISYKKKVIICVCISILAWLLYYIFYILLKKWDLMASNDSFFPRLKHRK